MKEVYQKIFLLIVVIPLFLSGCVTTSTTSGTSPVSAMQIKSLSPDNNKDLYQVTCGTGKQHIVIANHGEQDFQYYYQNKGYYIKYYDIEFIDLYDFAEWVYRNK